MAWLPSEGRRFNRHVLWPHCCRFVAHLQRGRRSTTEFHAARLSGVELTYRSTNECPVSVGDHHAERDEYNRMCGTVCRRNRRLFQSDRAATAASRVSLAIRPADRKRPISRFRTAWNGGWTPAHWQSRSHSKPCHTDYDPCNVLMQHLVSRSMLTCANESQSCPPALAEVC